MTVSDTRNAFVQGEKTASQIIDASLAAIGNRDVDYNAVIVAGGEAVSEAAEHLDALDKPGRDLLPLAGVPILVKDNIETREWPTTAGSRALINNSTGRDADFVTQLRAAGAIILGKANLSEWANFRSEKSISGWSGIGGQTRNAHDPTRSPCGSSSGSAVSVALGYVPVAIGSETDGSIVCPSAINGVVGFKPTHGLVSGKGVVPLATSQDTAGPIASDVQGAVTTLAMMIDTTGPQAADVRSRLLSLPSRGDLTGIRVGVIGRIRGYDSRRDALLDAALRTLGQLGAEVIEGVELKPYKAFNDDEYAVLLYEFREQVNAWLKSLPGAESRLTLTELVLFNEKDPVELSLFDQGIFEKARQLELTWAEYQEKLDRIRKAARDNGIDRAMHEQQLDVLVGTTVGPAWTIDDVNGDAFHGPSLSSFPAVGGHPHLTVPMGDIRGLPIGLSFIGGRFDDAGIADIARLYEKHR